MSCLFGGQIVLVTVLLLPTAMFSQRSSDDTAVAISVAGCCCCCCMAVVVPPAVTAGASIAAMHRMTLNLSHCGTTVNFFWASATYVSSSNALSLSSILIYFTSLFNCVKSQLHRRRITYSS